MRILVTGGAGFIGSNFIRCYLEHHQNDEIVNFDKLTYAGNLHNLQDIQNNKHYSFVQGDICDRELVLKTMKNIDVVVHFAAESHVDRSIIDPFIFIKTNVLGTGVLLDAALTNG
ncbi:GDP-mannose 4,6-dehydratase, partial [Candidatus Woesearchaeota archaeon]|nr:GDP-mannose 4,6-dehydratase [Candidatus Woesearchaeota archaeon]